MFSYRDKRLHLRYARPRSEEPLRLVLSDFQAFVPKAGFRWVSGVLGETGTPDRFLVPAKPKDEIELISPSQDAFLALTNLSPSESAYLDLANRFGYLEVVRIHFHSDETPIQWGEPLMLWNYEVRLFQRWFEVWKLYTDKNARLLRSKLQELLHPPPTANVFPLALDHLVHAINLHLWTDRFSPDWSRLPDAPSSEMDSACLTCGCACRRWVTKSHVPYSFRIVQEREGQTVKDKVVPVVRPTGFLAAAWLGFGELVAGQRTIRTCEVCGQWMDITDTAKPNAKRMHTRCSNTQRQRKWRQSKRARSSEGQP